MDGVLYEDDADVRYQLVLFYQGLYKETELWRPSYYGWVRFCMH